MEACCAQDKIREVSQDHLCERSRKTQCARMMMRLGAGAVKMKDTSREMRHVRG